MKPKSILLTFALAFIVTWSFAQDELPSTGSFGKSIDKKGAVSAGKLHKKMKNQESVDIKLKGQVEEVCQAKGCWMTIDLGNDELMRVKFKDYGFFVPKDAAGKTAIMQGVVTKETISVDELKHLAEDAGKPESEISKITEPKEELTFIAEGVIIE